MTKEDKQLLLQDLCERLPYGVVCVGITYELDDDGERYIPIKEKDILTEIHNYKIETASVRLGLLSSCKLETVKPYLRPMSSMTKEERLELSTLSDNDSVKFYLQGKDVKLCFMSGDCFKFYKIFDWLKAHHFDYRGLIEKGLAIEITEENNPYENNN